MRSETKMSAPTRKALDSAERSALEGEGFVVLERVVHPDLLNAFVDIFEHAARASDRSGGTRHPELDWSDSRMHAVLSEPRVLAAVDVVLGRPFVVLSAGGRDPLSGSGLQGLHTDWTPRSGNEPFYVATALWVLDDFSPTNGATRVVPGSHRDPRPLDKSMQQPAARHPRQEIVSAHAGDVLFFNGHVWHGGTRNESSSQRRVFQVQYAALEASRTGFAGDRPEIFQRVYGPGRPDAEAGDDGLGRGRNAAR